MARWDSSLKCQCLCLIIFNILPSFLFCQPESTNGDGGSLVTSRQVELRAEEPNHQNGDTDEALAWHHDSADHTLGLNFTGRQLWTDPRADSAEIAILKIDADHSIREFRKAIRICRSFSMNECHQVMKSEQENIHVEFNHIYSGRYCFRIALYSDLTLLNVRQYEHEVDDDFESDVFAWNLTVNLEADPHEGSIRLDLLLFQQDIYHFESLHVDLYRLVTSECFDTGDPENVHVDLDGSVTRQSISFRNHSQGFYCVVIEPEDERCYDFHFESDRTCKRYAVVELLRVADGVNEVWYTNGTFNFTVLLIGLTGLLFLIGLSVTYFHCKRSWHQFHHQPGVKPYQKVLDIESGTARLALLLLYSPKHGSVLEGVRNLKKNLRSYRVLDYFDPHDESVNVEGIHWFANRLSDPTCKVLVILCPEMIHYGRLMLEEGNPEDKMQLLGVYHLLQVVNLDPSSQYQRVYVARFDHVPMDEASPLVTPRRTYHLPSDLLSLLRDL